MSRKFIEISRVFLASCLLLGLMSSPSLAQYGGYGMENLFTVKGTDIKVNASGRLPGFGIDSCPFKIGTSPELYQAAFNAAKSGDVDSCPYADGPSEKIYLKTCGAFYQWLADRSLAVGSSEPNPQLSCCHERPGAPRNRCMSRVKQDAALQVAAIGAEYKRQGIISSQPGYLSADDLKQMMDEQKQKEEAKKQCFEDSLNRIGDYWAKQRSTACIAQVTRLVKSLLKNGIRDLKNNMRTNTAIGASSTQIEGAATAVVSHPSIWGAIQVATSVANFAADVIMLADEVSQMTNALTEGCGNLFPRLKESRLLSGGGLCQAAENLLERQLTQCIRVNVGVGLNLALPQFAVLLQCPVQVNINARLGPNGFDCYSGVSVATGKPISVAGGGRYSMMSGNGGLENLFNGNCYKNTSTPRSGFTGPEEPDTGKGRIPGVDCGKLDELDANKKVRLQGQVLLTPGYADDGWAVGSSEVVNGMTITRCDQYMGGKRLRTNYVYGSGASCNAGTSGFLSGGYETNSSCYASIGGGYTPAPASTIPDACMYDPGCLDPNGKLDPSKLGKTGCTTGSGKNPNFDETRSYNLFVTGGFGGGKTESKSCKDFAEAETPVLCCDPQKQDCSTRDVNVPLCACDEGDASNKVKVDPATGKLDAKLACEKGGRKTCCSPRLNGVAGCDAADMKAAGLEICADEKSSCLNMTDMATYTGPDGTTTKEYSAQKLATSKPSPYFYIFVRPDVQLPNGQQCCTTEWCNVCPQHYVNAYGLSLIRADSTLSATPSDRDNQKLLANGGRFAWPYIEEQDEIGNIEYKVGAAALPLTYTYNPKGDWTQKIKDYQTSYPPLHLSDMMPQPANMTICNKLSGLIATKQPSQHFKGSIGMAFTFNEQHKRDDWKTYAGVPEPREYPIDYLNRLRANLTDSNNIPLAPIQLCSDIKLCVPEDKSILGTGTSALGGTGGMTGTWTGGGSTTTTTTTGGTGGSTTTTTSTTGPSTTGTLGGATTSTTGTTTTTTGTVGGVSTIPSAGPSTSPAGGSVGTVGTVSGTPTTGGPTPVPSAGSGSSSKAVSGGVSGGLY